MANQRTIKFFCWQIPVVGEPEVIEFDDGPHKVWQLRLPDGVIPMREKVEVVTLQERFDAYVFQEAGLHGDALKLHKAIQFEPASPIAIKSWLLAHQKRELVNG